MAQPSFPLASLYVFIGGGLGAWLRYLVGRGMFELLGPMRSSSFPWATLTVNIVGSLAMGALVGWMARFGTHAEATRLFLAVGLLGGFTTFSSFSLEIVSLAERGDVGLAGLYVGISLLAGVFALVAGLTMMRGTT